MPPPYSIAVYGTRFLHLALATLLAKRGNKVLVVDPSGIKSGEEAAAAPSFRRRPAPLFGLDGGGLLRRFLDEIGIGQLLVKKAYPPNTVSYQVVLPRNRLDIHPDREALMGEIAREFPSSTDSLRSLYHSLDATADRWAMGTGSLGALEKRKPSGARVAAETKGWWTSRNLAAQMQSFVRTAGVSDFLSIQNHFLGGHGGSVPPSPLSAALIHGIGRRGTFQETLGTSSLTALMATRFQEFGGQILRRTSVVSVDARNRDQIVINLSEGNPRAARCLALSEDLAVGLDGLPPARKVAQAAGEGLVPLRFFIGLDERYVPAGMGEDVFFLREDEGGPLGARMLYLALGHSAAPPVADGQRSLTVTALVPPRVLQGRTADWDQAVRSDLISALEAIIPFLPEGLRSMRPDLPDLPRERSPRPLGGGLPSWDPFRVGRNRVRRLQRGRFFIMSPAPWELGLEGDVLTALAAAGMAARILGQD